MPPSPKFIPADQADAALREIARKTDAHEFALVANPAYIFSPCEIYPLPPRVTQPIPHLAGIVKDMDGTTTTTEPLCLHSLEWMVRQVTARPHPAQWPGLDRRRDYPHIIGNSTTRHVEYLLQTYQDAFSPEACLRAWIAAAAWTLAHGRDPGRRRELRANLTALGLAPLLADTEFQAICRPETPTPNAAEDFARRVAPRLLPQFRIDSLTQRVRAAVDIYYTRYHVILADIADGHARDRAREVLGSPEAHLIEPMPGIGPFLAALRGILGADLQLFTDQIVAHARAREAAVPPDPQALLAALGVHLAAHPAPVAVVTSSIAYEAGIVLDEVFRVLREQAAQWPVAPKKRDDAIRAFADPNTFYDAVITASDSSEIRLKPHRDLYSIALHALGIAPADFPCVAGFEDSESGVIAIRAAGVGLAVAVPFADTAGHDLSAAAHILHGQIPEALLRGLFLQPQTLGIGN